MKQLVFLLLLSFGARLVQAQELQVNEPPLVAQMAKNWANNNRSNPHIEGWRVQIMAGTDRTQVEEGRIRFRALYPEVPADWMHEKPYYKLKVGAFKSKLEAMAFISTLAEFPGAYPAKDANIHPRDFLKQ